MKSSNLLVLLIVAVVLLQEVRSDKILVLTFFSTKSQQLTYMKLIEELGKRGHEITIVTPVKPTKELKNIKQIFTYDVMEATLGSYNMFEMKETNANLNPFFMVEEFAGVCRKSYELPQVKAILNEKFDLVFVQPMFNDCVLGLVFRLKAPLVLFSPTTVSDFMVNKLGGHFPSSFVPNLLLGYPDEMTFPQRFLNYGMSVFTEAVLRFYYEPQLEAIYRDQLGQDIPSVREILGNASLFLSNGHFSVNKPKPMFPDVVDVGGIHSQPAKPLPKDLEDFISKSGKDGFILFSMGSAIKGDLMSETKRNMFLKVFSKLNQQVLWKWESETMKNLPKNVKLSKWLPQQDLLGHPNIKMFITHCGGGSSEESVYHGVPLLGLPMFGDQPLNAKTLKNHGTMIELDWNSLTEQELTDGINELLNNPKYYNNAKRLSTIFKDQPDKPLDRGIYWIEYILRHKGAPHLRSAARKLNYFQYHSWDIMATYLAIILTTFYLLFAISRFIIRKTCCKSSPKPKSLKKKKNQ